MKLKKAIRLWESKIHKVDKLILYRLSTYDSITQEQVIELEKQRNKFIVELSQFKNRGN